MFFGDSILMMISGVVIILMSLTVHEVSHGYAAYKLGDPTAKNAGRLSLNPLKHLDPIGAADALHLWLWLGKTSASQSVLF